MYLDNLDEIDQRLIDLLTKNARYSYSELGDEIGLSRVAVKNHIDSLEERGIIEGYTVIINPQRVTGAISLFYDIEAEANKLNDIITILNSSDVITQIYRVTGECRLHVHGVVKDQNELDSFTQAVIDKLPGVKKITSSVILTRIKDVKGIRL